MDRKNEKLCCIVGFDGHDRCLLFSLAAFYMWDGYDIVYSRTPVKCDLLVIYRGNAPSEIRYEVFASHVHYYGACWEPKEDEVRKLERVQHTIIVASPYTAAKVGPKLANRDVVVSYLPVHLSPWVNIEKNNYTRERNRAIPHVGHFKTSMYDACDRPTIDFIDFAKVNNVKLYGKRWEAVFPVNQIVDMFIGDKIPSFYLQYRCTAGIQYNFQRGKIISARFWEAPLSGCVLLTEASVHGRDACPGVVNVDYSDLGKSQLEYVIDSISPRNLSEVAMQYWQLNNQRLAAKLGMHNALERMIGSRTMNNIDVRGGDHCFVDAANLQ